LSGYAAIRAGLASLLSDAVSHLTEALIPVDGAGNAADIDTVAFDSRVKGWTTRRSLGRLPW
jgi:hypothetical protein